VAKTYGQTFPERQLMAVLSDLLGIPHFTTSRGSTVRSDFLHAVAARLDVRDHERLAKDALILAITDRVFLGDPPSGIRWTSPGGTVKNETLAHWVEGIGRHHLVDTDPLADQASDTPAGGTLPDDPFPGAAGPLPEGQDALDLPLSALEDLLDTGHDLNPEDRRLLALAYRTGQDRFRTAVLDAYRQRGAEACCVTGPAPVQALEAAHIRPHSLGGPMSVSNGLALRADLHNLFDRRLLAVHETTFRVLLNPVVTAVPGFADFAGTTIHVPTAPADRPAAAFLLDRRLAAGL
jgi:putative restriction endonuclease